MIDRAEYKVTANYDLEEGQTTFTPLRPLIHPKDANPNSISTVANINYQVKQKYEEYGEQDDNVNDRTADSDEDSVLISVGTISTQQTPRDVPTPIPRKSAVPTNVLTYQEAPTPTIDLEMNRSAKYISVSRGPDKEEEESDEEGDEEEEDEVEQEKMKKKIVKHAYQPVNISSTNSNNTTNGPSNHSIHDQPPLQWGEIVVINGLLCFMLLFIVAFIVMIS
jgi:hypothetical protein